MGTLIPPVSGNDADNDLDWQQHKPSKAKIVATTPLRLVSGGTRIVSRLVKDGILVPASAISYASVSAIHGLFKALTYVTKTAATAESLQALSNTAKEINEELIDANMRLRTERQETIQTVSMGAKVINFVPIIGPVIANTVELASHIAALEAKGERTVSWAAKHYVRCVFEFLRHSCPAMLGGANTVLSSAEKTTNWMKELFHTGTFGKDALADQLTALADRADAIRWKLIHTATPSRILSDERMDVASFKALDKDAQNDIIFAVEHAQSIHLTKEQHSNFQDAVRRLQQGYSDLGIDIVIQELLELFDRLTIREKHRITPADFKAMDAFDIVKLLKALQEHPEKLSLDQQACLTKLSHIKTRQDLQELDKTQLEQLQKLIVMGSLHLSAMELLELNTLSLDELITLPKHELSLLLHLVTTLVGQKGTASEKVRLELIAKSGQITEKELKLVALLIQKYLSESEKAILISALRTRLKKVQGSPDELNQLINELEKTLALKPNAQDALALQHTLHLLQSIAPKKPVPIDMELIMERIGPQVVTKGYIYNALMALNHINQSALSTAGSLSRAALEKVNCSKLFNGTASALEILMVLPYGKNFIASLLARSGIPVYKIEAAIAKLLIQTAKIPLTLTGQAIETSQEVLETIEAVGKNAKKQAKTEAKSWANWFNPVKQYLNSWTDSAANLAESKTQQDAAELSRESLLTLSGIWNALLQKSQKNEQFAHFVHKIYSENIGPSLQQGLNAVDGVYKIAAANYKLYEATMDIGLQTELQAQQFLHDKAKIAHDTAAKSDSSLKQTLFEGISWGLPALSWLFLSSNTLIALPFIVQRIFPHVLRSIATKTGPSFWQQAAKNSEALFTKGAKLVSKGYEKSAHSLSKLTSQSSIDLLRIEGFKNLAPNEQQHIFDLTKTVPEEFTDEDTLICHTLQALDAREETAQVMSVGEFFELSIEQQQELFFAVTHSSRYKHFRDDDPSRVIRKYIELAAHPIACYDEASYQKLPIHDKEKIRLSIAQNAHILNDITYIYPDELLEWQRCMNMQVSEGWQYQQYRAISRISNHRLQNILKLYSSLSASEKELLFPRQLKKMSPAKLKQVLDILDRYHPDLVDTYNLKSALSSNCNSTIEQKARDTVLTRVASVFTLLNSAQKSELLRIEKAELDDMPLKMKRDLILFMMQHVKNPQALQNELTKDVMDANLIQRTFNRLEKTVQAAWYDLLDAQEVQNKSVNKLLLQECEALKAKIQVVERRIAKQTDTHYMALSYEIHSKQMALSEAKADLESKNAVAESLETALSGMQLRSHVTKTENLKKLRSEIDQVKNSITKIQSEIQSLTERQKAVSSKILHLHTLQYDWQQKLASLTQILGLPQMATKSYEEIPESPAVLQTIETIINVTVHESCKTVKEALVHNVHKHAANPVHCDRQISFSRELIDELISCRKEHAKVIQDKIASLQEEIIHEKDIEKLTELKLKIRALHQFNLRLNSALSFEFEKLKDQFEQDLRLIMINRQEALMSATEKLRSMASSTQVAAPPAA